MWWWVRSSGANFSKNSISYMQTCWQDANLDSEKRLQDQRIVVCLRETTRIAREILFLTSKFIERGAVLHRDKLMIQQLTTLVLALSQLDISTIQALTIFVGVSGGFAYLLKK